MYSVLKTRRRAKITLLITKIFQEHQPNSRRFPVFPGAISNSRRFPVVVDTLTDDTTLVRIGRINTLAMPVPSSIELTKQSH